MVRRPSIWLTLICYSVISLFGQGLHLLAHDDLDAGHGECSVHEGLCNTAEAAVRCQSQHHADHDAEHCSICQHQSLGQVFAPEPPAEILLSVCEYLSVSAPEVFRCAEIYAVSLPRAPPVC